MSNNRRAGGSLAHSNNVAAGWFILPILVIFTILTIVPLSQSILWSFSDFNVYTGESNFVGLANYERVVNDSDLLGGATFTLIYAFAATAATTVLAIPLAVLLNRPFFGRDFSRAVFFFLGVPSLAIIGLVWRFIFSPLDSGVANNILVSLGMEGLPWLADAGLARFAVVFVGVWAGVGWHATLYLAYMQAIPGDLYEQAKIDGATAFKRFTNVTLPQLVPAISVSTFLLITFGLKVYDLPFTLTSGGPANATFTLTHAITERGVARADYGLGSALAVLFALATLVVILGQMALSKFLSRRFT